jgi:hypothetical protein
MTTIKLQGKLPAAVTDVLAPLADQIYKDPGGYLVGIVELRHVDHNDPAEDVDDIKRAVTLRITSLEVGHGEQEHNLRAAQQALYAVRTAGGTLDPDGEVALAEDTLRLTEGLLYAEEAARLRVGLRHFADLARGHADDHGADLARSRRCLAALADGLAGLVHHTQTEDIEG